MNINFGALSAYRLSMAACIFFIMAAAPSAGAAPGYPKDSRPIEVPATRAGSPYASNAARNIHGAYAVVWKTTTPGSGFGQAIWARVYTSQGVPRGPEFKVAAGQDLIGQPAVGIDAAGNTVVVWKEVTDPASASDESFLKGRRFDASGNPLGATFTIVQTSGNLPRDGLLDLLFPSRHSFVSLHGGDVAMTPGGRFVVAWRRASKNHYRFSFHGNSRIEIRRYSADGSPLDSEPRAVTQRRVRDVFAVVPPLLFARFAKTMGEPSVALNAEGEFVVVWSTTRQPILAVLGGGLEQATIRVYARRFTGNDNLRSLPRTLISRFHSSDLPYLPSPPSVDMGPDGTYAVAWQQIDAAATDADSGSETSTLLFRRIGSGSGAEVEVAEETGLGLFPDPEIGLADDGTLMVAWGRHARVFGAQDQSLTPVFEVNERQEEFTQVTSVDAGGAAGFLVTWDSGQFADNTIFTRRFASE